MQAGMEAKNREPGATSNYHQVCPGARKKPSIVTRRCDVSGYTKLFHSILGSTIWSEDLPTKVTWITLLALANKDGVAEASVPGLARFAGVSVEQAESAIRKFLSPDPYSRSPENEGRRIEAVDGGWRLLNHDKYREKLSPEHIKQQAAARAQRYRDRHRDASVTERDESRESRQEEEEAYKESVKSKPLVHSGNEPDGRMPIDSVNRGKFAKAQRTVMATTIYDRYPRKQGKPEGIKAIEKSIIAVAKRDFDGDDQAAADWLMEKLNQYSRSVQGSRPEKTLIPFPATWFNGQRFDDDQDTWNYAGTTDGVRGGLNGSTTRTQLRATTDRINIDEAAAQYR